MNRTFTTASVVSLPTRRTTPSWITRSSLAWIGFDMSTSSSSSNVPPFAASSRPGLSRTAPVNAPLQCPNISDSSSASGNAAQLTATSGRLLRRLWWWMNWAINSLPEPLSPVMKTEASVGATRRARPTARRNAGEDRKSTRLNSSHGYISYAVFCLKKKRHPRRFKIVVIDIQITLKQMLRDFIGIRVNRAKKSGMVNITSSVNSRERSGINTILHELNPLFTINVTMRDIKSKNVYSRVNSKATTQWRKTESANGVHLEGVASDNRSS